MSMAGLGFGAESWAPIDYDKQNPLLVYLYQTYPDAIQVKGDPARLQALIQKVREAAAVLNLGAASQSDRDHAAGAVAADLAYQLVPSSIPPGSPTHQMAWVLFPPIKKSMQQALTGLPVRKPGVLVFSPAGTRFQPIAVPPGPPSAPAPIASPAPGLPGWVLPAAAVAAGAGVLFLVTR